ncbi:MULTISPECIES: SpoIIE family protein phosphatase [unclassified Streptomyces]|uniref:SpoIIE family protein phosphatase n=1 Tax=unclassified Streptomyces TaxID=2593676 RepID=UPI00037E45DD|nr:MULTISPECIES: SpoIIE family protein phosphatase [unclassified Streptomyces]MYY05827.1 SpoIIE family protein phosphatase [Streptomyces sp. SID4913]
MGNVGPVTDSADDLLDAAVARAVRETGAAVAMLYVLPPGSPTLRLAVLAGVPQEMADPWLRVPLSAPMPVADAVKDRHLVWLGSQEELARSYPRPALVLPYRFALAAAPVLAGTTALGGLVLLWPGSHPPQLTPRERAAVHDCCGEAARVLHEAREKGRPVGAGAGPRVLPPVTTAPPARAEAVAAADFVARLPGGCCTLDTHGRITYLTDAGAALVGRRADELVGTLPWESLRWLADPHFEDQYRGAMISREPMSFTALRPPDQWLSFCLYPDASGISVYITPVSAPHSPTPPTAAAAPPSTPGRAVALYQLMHLAATLTEAVGIRDVVELISEQFVPAFRIQAFAVMTAAEGRLGIDGHRGFDAELMECFEGAPLSSHAPVAHVLTTGVPAFYRTFDEFQRAFEPATLQQGLAAWAFLPLLASGRPVGTLVLGYERTRPFEPEERALLTSIAGLIAQALDRARLFDTKEQLAHSLQAHLLPHTLPAIDGLDVAARYLPATRGMGIGGDFYDVIRLDATTAAAAIGDVQGHNVKAAVLMGQVRTAVHASAGAPPAEVLERTNRLLTDLDPGLFTSCLYVHLDLAGHRALMATAGHPPPLLRRPGGQTEVLRLPPGLLLGIDRAARYPTTEIPLPPGAALALYTDGLVEVPGTDPDESTAALAGQFARGTGRSMDALADSLVRYAQHATPGSDDIALLLIEALGKGRG